MISTNIKTFTRRYGKLILLLLLGLAIIGTVSLFLEMREDEGKRRDAALIEQGETRTIIRTQERTIQDVAKANDAVERPVAGAVERVYAQGDRCARTPSACE